MKVTLSVTKQITFMRDRLAADVQISDDLAGFALTKSAHRVFPLIFTDM
jgi:hypothetical protein